MRSLVLAGGALFVALLASIPAASAAISAPATTRGDHGLAADPPSSNPYVASLAYARCMRRHGVPHPNPNRQGDFHLTPADERRMRRVSPRKRQAAEKACFRHLKGLNLQPLSPQAIKRAENVLADFAACLRRKGHRVGAPDVRNMSRGRARFGLKPLPYQEKPGFWQTPAGRRLARDMGACEKEVNMARRITRIIEEDRQRTDP